jgi:hypothetical protein
MSKEEHAFLYLRVGRWVLAQTLKQTLLVLLFSFTL